MNEVGTHFTREQWGYLAECSESTLHHKSDSFAHAVTSSPSLRFVGKSLSVVRCGVAWRMLAADGKAADMGLLLRSSKLLQTLGSTTVVAIPDKQGILSEGAPSIKQAQRPAPGVSSMQFHGLTHDAVYKQAHTGPRTSLPESEYMPYRRALTCK